MLEERSADCQGPHSPSSWLLAPGGGSSGELSELPRGTAACHVPNSWPRSSSRLALLDRGGRSISVEQQVQGGDGEDDIDADEASERKDERREDKGEREGEAEDEGLEGCHWRRGSRAAPSSSSSLLPELGRGVRPSSEKQAKGETGEEGASGDEAPEQNDEGREGKRREGEAAEEVRQQRGARAGL